MTLHPDGCPIPESLEGDSSSLPVAARCSVFHRSRFALMVVCFDTTLLLPQLRFCHKFSTILWLIFRML